MIVTLWAAWVAWVAWAAWAGLAGGTSAGVWVDDGFGYTVKAELPPSEAKALKRHMLDLFGLPHPMRHRRPHPKNASAPAFLRAIYDALDERGNAPRLDAEHRATVGAADVIITFVNINSALRHFPDSHRRLIFNMDDVPLADSLIGAELRVYKESPLRNTGEDLVLQVYLGAKEKSEERVIAKTILPDKGWVSLNVTAAVLSWIVFPESNKGLRLAVTRPSHKHELHLTEVGVAGGHSEEDKRPFVVGFFAQPKKNKDILHSRRIRSTIHQKSDYDYKKMFATSLPAERQESPPETQCQKRPLHVSFEDLGWKNWVIAPEGYDANFCDGRCQFPLLAGMNATNHALIQTLVKMKKAYREGDRPPPDACCAPRDLTTISVLYYDYSDNVVLKKYPKMIVKTCGCF